MRKRNLTLTARNLKIQVSVPLRGLDMRKPREALQFESLNSQLVSVPLRGLDMRKRHSILAIQLLSLGFSPLAGIRYAETSPAPPICNSPGSFSPLAGIRYAETHNRV